MSKSKLGLVLSTALVLNAAASTITQTSAAYALEPARPTAMCAALPPYAGTDWTSVTPGSLWIGLALYGGSCYESYQHQLVFATDSGAQGIDLKFVQKGEQRPRQWGVFTAPFGDGPAIFQVEVVRRGRNVGLLQVDWQYRGAGGTTFFRRSSSRNARLPKDGSYLDSCDVSRYDANLLQAECADTRGQWLQARLKYPAACVDDITNLDGRLVCTNRKFPKGSYQRVCADIGIDDGQQKGICRDDAGTWRIVSRNAWESCPNGIVYAQGQLLCDQQNGNAPQPAQPPPAQAQSVQDCSSGIAQITAPGDGAALSGIVNIYGSATCNGLRYYKFEFENCGPGVCFVAGPQKCDSDNVCDPAFGFTRPVQNSVLMNWDTRTVPNGTYALRLVVVGSGSYVLSQIGRVRVTIQN